MASERWYLYMPVVASPSMLWSVDRLAGVCNGNANAP